jgi:hypothetical protein
MSQQPQQQKPDPKKAETPADSQPRLVPVKIRWAKGGELGDGRFDVETGVVYATRARRPVISSIHSGAIDWVSPV